MRTKLHKKSPQKNAQKLDIENRGRHNSGGKIQPKEVIDINMEELYKLLPSETNCTIESLQAFANWCEERNLFNNQKCSKPACKKYGTQFFM